jgi:hypothetical protein
MGMERLQRERRYGRELTANTLRHGGIFIKHRQTLGSANKFHNYANLRNFLRVMGAITTK